MSLVATARARLRHFLRGLFRRDQVESDLRRELDSYLDMLVEQKVAEGLPPCAARRAARLEFGGIDQVAEQVRDVRLAAWVERAGREIRGSVRSLARSPGFTAVVVLTLGVGIGANAAIFSFVNALMLRPMPFPAADRLVAVQVTAPPSPFFVTPGDYVDWKTHNEVFQTLSGYAFQSLALTEAAGASGDAELLQLAVTSADFFRTLRARPLLGRTFLPDEDQAGRERVAVLSHGLWTRRFGSERGIVGREIALDGLSHSVIGVMPADFDFPVGAVDAWIPMVVTPVQRNDRRDHSVLTVPPPARGVPRPRAGPDAGPGGTSGRDPSRDQHGARGRGARAAARATRRDRSFRPPRSTGGGVRAVDCLRQRVEPAGGPGGCEGTGNGHSRGAGRRAVAHRRLVVLEWSRCCSRSSPPASASPSRGGVWACSGTVCRPRRRGGSRASRTLPSTGPFSDFHWRWPAAPEPSPAWWSRPRLGGTPS